jgi:mannosyl-oligosaccharide alpha-1,2-mannosidase
LKYFYLLFGPNDVWPLDKIVINTEAHAFPRFKMDPLFKTGWKRKPRDADGNIIPGEATEALPSQAKAETVAATQQTVVSGDAKHH